MRNLANVREIASEAPPCHFMPSDRIFASRSEGSLAMWEELIPWMPSAEWVCAPGSGPPWLDSPLRSPSEESELEQSLKPLRENAHYFASTGVGVKREFEEKPKEEFAASQTGHSLFQEWFFFCRVRKVGDIPGTENIYVETVVDRDSGIAFAKLYSAKSAINAVDILASRVLPFFQRLGHAIREICTRKSSQYCGLPPAHPFETFLATSHIQHLEIEESSQPESRICEQFYRFLLKEFFPPTLRKHFHLSLAEMQKDLDAFVEEYNAMQMKRGSAAQGDSPATSKFPVDL